MDEGTGQRSGGCVCGLDAASSRAARSRLTVSTGMNILLPTLRVWSSTRWPNTQSKRRKHERTTWACLNCLYCGGRIGEASGDGDDGDIAPPASLHPPPARCRAPRTQCQAQGKIEMAGNTFVGRACNLYCERIRGYLYGSTGISPDTP